MANFITSFCVLTMGFFLYISKFTGRFFCRWQTLSHHSVYLQLVFFCIYLSLQADLYVANLITSFCALTMGLFLYIFEFTGSSVGGQTYHNILCTYNESFLYISEFTGSSVGGQPYHNILCTYNGSFSVYI